MTRSALRVIQWATGRVGLPSLQGILNHPDLELVGLYVSSDAKAGRDAADVLGGGVAPTGVVATNAVQHLLETDADCVVYCATDVDRVDEVIDDLVAILSSGKNVVNTSITQLVWPPGMDAGVIERLENACSAGGSSLYNTGIHPGLVSDQLVFLLSNLSQGVESVSVAAMLDVSSYDPAVLDFFGIGKTPDQDAEDFDPAVAEFFWMPVLSALAEGFGVEIDEVRFFRRPEVLAHGFTTSSGLEVPPHTISAFHYGFEGLVAGEARIVVENYEKVCPDVPEGWPPFPSFAGEPAGGHRIVMTGSPAMQVDVAFGHPTDPLTDVLIGTAMQAVNTVAATADAPPGIVDSFADLPHVRGFMLPHASTTRRDGNGVR